MNPLVGTTAHELYADVELDGPTRKAFRTGIGGGSTVAWASCPLNPTSLAAQAFAVNLYAHEAADLVNLRAVCTLKRYLAANDSTITIAQASAAAEYPFALGPITVAGAIPSGVTINAGDRLVVDCFSVPVATSFDSADPDVTVRYDDDAANEAASYLELTQVVGCFGSPMPSATATTTPTATETTTPDPSATATPSPTATATATGIAPQATATPMPEICDDCIDNDGNGFTDRDDPACGARADGDGHGLDDPEGAGKALFACQQALGKAGAHLATARVRALHACLTGIFGCVQEDGSSDCFAAASARCTKQLGKLVAIRANVVSNIVDRCGDPPLQAARLGDAVGLGFDAEVAACAAAGVGSLTNAADVAACVIARHECRVDRLVGDELPRARALLSLAGRDPATDAPCLPATNASGSAGDGALATCAEALAKAGARLVTARTNVLQRCAEGAARCIQRRPDDAQCLGKARDKCLRLRTALDDRGSGADAAFTAAFRKRCAPPTLATSALIDATGLALGERAAACAALGVGPLDSATAIADCLARLHACRADQVLESRVPRLAELLRLVD